jgi:di/tricarboxylate transporter
MRIADMVRAGVLLDAVAVGVITLLVTVWASWTT